jgi:hypothetical protein
MRPADVGIAQEALGVAARDLAGMLGDGQLDVLPGRPQRRAVLTDHLLVSGRAAQCRARDAQEELARLRRELGAERNARDRLGPLLQALVHLTAQLVTHDEVDERGGEYDRERHRRGGGEREPRAEGHDSRSA